MSDEEQKSNWEYEKQIEILRLELQLERLKQDIKSQRERVDFDRGLYWSRLEKDYLLDFNKIVDSVETRVMMKVLDLLRRTYGG